MGIYLSCSKCLSDGETGIWQLENLTTGMEAISVGLFTRVLGWSKPELDVFLEKVKAELKDPKVHSYYEV